MRITHKVRPPRDPKPVEIDPAYQAEVDRSTAKLEREHRAAQRRVEGAARRLRRAETARNAASRAAEVRELRIEWERRVAELDELERLMRSAPAGGLAHRGREGWTKVPR